MKLIYTNENPIVVSSVRNMLELEGIRTILKNEFASSGVGELAPHQAWTEIWIADENDYEKAVKLANEGVKTNICTEWICKKCNEINSPSFEICWNCQAEYS